MNAPHTWLIHTIRGNQRLIHEPSTDEKQQQFHRAHDNAYDEADPVAERTVEIIAQLWE